MTFGGKIATAVSCVFEEMAFLETRYLGRGNFGGICFWGRISILAPVPAELFLAIPEEISREIAAVVFNQGNTDDEAIGDLIGEFANIIAGRSLADEGDAISLGTPTTGYGEVATHDNWEIFALDDERRFAVGWRLIGSVG